MAKKANNKKIRETELPFWIVVFLTIIFVSIWFFMSKMIFLTSTGFVFWVIVTMLFLFPLALIWMIYLRILKL